DDERQDDRDRGDEHRRHGEQCRLGDDGGPPGRRDQEGRLERVVAVLTGDRDDRRDPQEEHREDGDEHEREERVAAAARGAGDGLAGRDLLELADDGAQAHGEDDRETIEPVRDLGGGQLDPHGLEQRLRGVARPRYATASSVGAMKASSRDARISVSSCTVTPRLAAKSPTHTAVATTTVNTPLTGSKYARTPSSRAAAENSSTCG